MRHLLVLLAACSIGVSAQAGDDKRERRLKSRDAIARCQVDAGSMEGGQREAYMQKCLSLRESRSARSNRCTQEAYGLRGDERRRYVAACLRGEVR